MLCFEKCQAYDYGNFSTSLFELFGNFRYYSEQDEADQLFGKINKIFKVNRQINKSNKKIEILLLGNRMSHIPLDAYSSNLSGSPSNDLVWSVSKDVLFEFHLKFGNIASIGIPVKSLLKGRQTSNWSN